MTYDDFGAQMRAAYDVYVLSLTGVYMGFKAAGRGADAVTELRHAGIGLLQTLDNSIRNMIGQYLNTLPDGPDTSGREAHFRSELHRIGTKNLNDLIVRLMGLGLQRTADILTQPAGAIGKLLQQKLSRPHFTARDSAGRAWDAAKLVSLLARDLAYQTYVDAMLARYASADMVSIVYADAGRNQNLTPDEARARRGALFHVNATARIESHVSP